MAAPLRARGTRSSARLASDRLQGLDDVGQHRSLRSTLLGERQVLAHLHARERQQIVDQARHALGLLAHDLEEALARLRVVLGAPCSVSTKPLQRGQRRAQLVAGVGDEIGAHARQPVLLAEVAEGDEQRRAAAGAPATGRGARRWPAGAARPARARAARRRRPSPRPSAWSTASSSSGSRLMEATWPPRRGGRRTGPRPGGWRARRGRRSSSATAGSGTASTTMRQSRSHVRAVRVRAAAPAPQSSCGRPEQRLRRRGHDADQGDPRRQSAGHDKEQGQRRPETQAPRAAPTGARATGSRRS